MCQDFEVGSRELVSPQGSQATGWEKKSQSASVKIQFRDFHEMKRQGKRLLEVRKLGKQRSLQGQLSYASSKVAWMGREAEGGLGWGTHVNPWLIHVNVWQKPLQYCKVISLQLWQRVKRK